jgi:hypothetical protein
MAIPRTKSVSTKVTESEYARIQELAGAQTVSECMRAILLKAVQPDSTLLVLMAEIVALRSIILNLHFAIANGNTVTGDQMQSFIDRADQEKLNKAEGRLAAGAGRAQWSQLPASAAGRHATSRER